MLKEIAKANDDADIKIAVMQFSSGCYWITGANGAINLEDWNWEDPQAGGITNFGAALIELDKKMLCKVFLNSQTGAYAPVILLFIDGGPTDKINGE